MRVRVLSAPFLSVFKCGPPEDRVWPFSRACPFPRRGRGRRYVCLAAEQRRKSLSRTAGESGRIDHRETSGEKIVSHCLCPVAGFSIVVVLSSTDGSPRDYHLRPRCSGIGTQTTARMARPESDGLEALHRETVLDVEAVAEGMNECRRRREAFSWSACRNFRRASSRERRRSRPRDIRPGAPRPVASSLGGANRPSVDCDQHGLRLRVYEPAQAEVYFEEGLSPWLRERMMLRAFPLLEGPDKARAAL